MQQVHFGTTGRTVTRIGLGGEGVLRTHGNEAGAAEVLREAEKQGIRYFDSARVYADSELYQGAFWSRSSLGCSCRFQTSKSACRDRLGAERDLRQSLQRLQSEYLDLWQIHDLRTMEELDRVLAPGGALEAFNAARESGLVRHIGITGHHDPGVLTRAAEVLPVDAVLLPVNPVEACLGGFLSATLPAARKRGLAVIGMKVLGGAHYLHPGIGVSAADLVRYSLSWPVDLVVVGCSTAAEVRTLAAAEAAPPLTPAERDAIEQAFAPYARRLAFYRGAH